MLGPPFDPFVTSRMAVDGAAEKRSTSLDWLQQQEANIAPIALWLMNTSDTSNEQVFLISFLLGGICKHSKLRGPRNLYGERIRQSGFSTGDVAHFRPLPHRITACPGYLLILISHRLPVKSIFFSFSTAMKKDGTKHREGGEKKTSNNPTPKVFAQPPWIICVGSWQCFPLIQSI